MWLWFWMVGYSRSLWQFLTSSCEMSNFSIILFSMLLNLLISVDFWAPLRFWRNIDFEKDMYPYQYFSYDQHYIIDLNFDNIAIIDPSPHPHPSHTTTSPTTDGERFMRWCFTLSNCKIDKSCIFGQKYQLLTIWVFLLINRIKTLHSIHIHLW